MSKLMFAVTFHEIINKFSNIELFSITNQLNIHINGTEENIARRILTALTDLEALDTAFAIATDSEIEPKDGDKTIGPTPSENGDTTGDSNSTCMLHDTKMEASNMSTAIQFSPKPSILFADFEDLIALFSGTKTDNIEPWLAHFARFF